MDKLTIKQKKFVDAYIVSGNATEAYLQAYAKQSRRSAEANARKLLAKHSVRTYLAERMKELESETIADQTEVLEFITGVMRAKNSGDNGAEKTDGEISMKDRLKAAELLGRFYALFTDKKEVEADTNLSIEVKYADNDTSE
ncbi:terminase small subunit [Murdochiella massiliensis]|uniref:terminase small subunit n=1 Tax=Murdochiella massiliensis TaxID=1673723 RepID=UPI00082C5C90|nr:terminase small subunit [Murdochiella massiliensis]